MDALLDAPRPEPRASRMELLASPNPASERTTFSYSLPQPGHVRLAVYDASGRRVSLLMDGNAPAGRHEARWVTPAAPGLYFARLDAPGGVRRVARFVRLR